MSRMVKLKHKNNPARSDNGSMRVRQGAVKVPRVSQSGNILNSIPEFARPFKQASDFVVIADTKGRITYANEAVERRTGYKIDEIIGKKPSDLWGGHMSKEFYQKMWHTLATKKEPFTGLLKNRRKDGSFFFVEMRMYPIMNIHGSLEGFMSIEADITARKQAEEALSMLIHRAKSPVSAEKLMLDILKADAGNLSAEQRHLIEDLASSNDYTLDLLRHILIASRLREISGNSLSTAGTLSMIVEGVVEKYSRAIATKKLRIAYGKCSRAPQYVPFLMYEILDNLISNAIKYSNASDTILFSCEKKGRKLIFTCKDSGIGIPKPQQRSVFKPFFRASNAKEVSEGTSSGLGLYLAKQIADQLGYRLSFRSKENKGTVFTLEMPLSDICAR